MDIRGVRIRAMREQCLDRGELAVRCCEHEGRTAVRVARFQVRMFLQKCLQHRQVACARRRWEVIAADDCSRDGTGAGIGVGRRCARLGGARGCEA